MNRILHYLQAPCSHCRQLNEIERQLDAAGAEAERIEGLASGIFEFWIPDAARVLKPKADDEDGVGIGLVLLIEPRHADIGEDLTRFVVDELRSYADRLLSAAAAVEGGAA